MKNIFICLQHIVTFKGRIKSLPLCSVKLTNTILRNFVKLETRDSIF